MNKVIYLTMVSADQLMSSQNIHANNLANASTSGFRADLQSLTSEPIKANGLPTLADRPVTKENYTNFTPGTLITTGSDFDIAIADKGWLAVRSQDGSEAYTRAGDLTMSDIGELTTSSGEPLLSSDGATMNILNSDSINIATDGTVSAYYMVENVRTPITIGRLKFVNPPIADMVKGTDGLFRLKNNVPAEFDPNVKVRQGAYESSNVNIVSELVDMMQMSRSFELQLKLMKDADQNDGHAITLMNLNA